MLQITNTKINNQEINAVSARELHKFLECTERFSAWFERMCQYGFEEQQDFTGVKSFTVVNNGAEKPLDDFMISIDMAKEISMLQRSDKGKEARKYFIECEKQLKDLTPKFANMSPQLQLLIQMEQQQNEIKATLDFQAEQLKSVEHKLSQTDAATITTLLQDLPICMELMLMTRPQTKQGAKHRNYAESAALKLEIVEVQSLVKLVLILKKYCMKCLTS